MHQKAYIFGGGSGLNLPTKAAGGALTVLSTCDFDYNSAFAQMRHKKWG